MLHCEWRGEHNAEQKGRSNSDYMRWYESPIWEPIWPRLSRVIEEIQQHPDVYVLAVVTFVLAFVTALMYRLEKRKRKEERSRTQSQFEIRRVEEFDPGEIVGGYTAAGVTDYLPISQDTEIRGSLMAGQDTGILGRPGIGKSHSAAYHISQFPGWYLIRPRRYSLEGVYKIRVKRRRYFLLLDDLNEYAATPDGTIAILDLVDHLRSQAKQLIVVATLRSTHPEFAVLESISKLLARWRWIRLADWPQRQAKNLADRTGVGLERWDGTPLSVKQPSPEMEHRYLEFLSSESRSLLRALKMLTTYGVRPVDGSLLRDLCASNVFNVPRERFDSSLWDVRTKGFLKAATHYVEAYAPYLDSIARQTADLDSDYLVLRDVLIKGKKVEELILVAAQWYGRSNFIEATFICNRCIELEPQSPTYHYWLGLVLRGAGKRNEAVESFRTAIRIKPNFARAHSYLARTLREMGKFDDALKENETAARLSPNSADEQFGLGLIFREIGDLRAAETALRRLSQRDPLFLLLTRI